MQLLRIDEIVTNPNQPRRTFYESSLEELAASIKERGVLEPIIVRPKDGRYQLVIGERRYRAATMAGLTEIPAVIREMSDEDVASDALLENFQREDLNPVDRAKAIEELLSIMSMEKCAKTLGVSASTLRRNMELLELPNVVQQALVEAWDKTSGSPFGEGHARVLKAINGDTPTQARLVEKIKDESLSVSETQRLLDALRDFPTKRDAFLKVPIKVTDEILRQMHKVQKDKKPFKPQTAEQHIAAFEKTANRLSELIDERLTEYLKSNQMNQLLSTCSTLLTELEDFTRHVRSSLKKGESGFEEVYIHCPLCGRIELVGSLKCGVCWSVLRRCVDCGHYDKTYQKCAITAANIYSNEADSPREDSKSFRCTNYKPKFAARKVA